MSNETIEWLNRNTLIGRTAERGNAWHNRDDMFMLDGLTNHYPGEIPADDILTRLFNFKAVEMPLYVNHGGAMLPVDGRKALVRSDNGHVMGIHTDGYKGHDYAEWLVENLARLVDTRTGFTNAGLLRRGAVAWVQIETPESVTSGSGVTFRPSILAFTSFDGSLATGYKPVITNTVCDNTMAGALSEDSPVYRQKHTRNSRFVLADARAALDMLTATAESVSRQIDRLTETVVSEAQWSEFVTAHVPVEPGAVKRTVTMAETKRAALTGLWRTDVRVAPWHGTAWGVMQAVNTYNEHKATMKGGDKPGARFERKMTRAIGADVQTADRAAMLTLSDIVGRELILA